MILPVSGFQKTQHATTACRSLKNLPSGEKNDPMGDLILDLDAANGLLGF